MDTFPETTLTPYLPNPTPETALTYYGSVTAIPYPNNNPRGPGNDVTINTIVDVQFRVDGGSWKSLTPTAGIFDEVAEDFTFTTSPRTLSYFLSVQSPRVTSEYFSNSSKFPIPHNSV